MTRSELQNEVLDKFKENNNILAQWCTGLGKSRLALLCLNYVLELNNKAKILLIVAETAHKNNWKEDADKWNISLKNVTIDCYASLKKHKDNQYDLTILDEAHHLSDERLSILKTIKTKYSVFLSATLPDLLIEHINNYCNNKLFRSEVTLNDAIDYGFLPKPKIYLIGLELDNTKYNRFITKSWGDKDKRRTIKCTSKSMWSYMKNKHIYKHIDLKITATERGVYDDLDNQYNYLKSRYLRCNNEKNKVIWLSSGRKRKDYLGISKTKYVQELINKLQKKNKRFICFCTNIEQADMLDSKNSIHSKKGLSQKLIKDFNSKKIDSLIAINMLQEGQNLVDIDAGIITQLDGISRPFIQKLGRVMRADYPIQYVFYYKNTKDEEYLKGKLEGINEEYLIYVNNVKDIQL